MTYRSWLEQHLASAVPWHAHVDARRAEAMRPRRTASAYSIASYPTLDSLRAAREGWVLLPRASRAFAWGDDRLEERQRADPIADLAPNEPLDHLRRWERGLRRDETRWLGVSAADELHSFYCAATGYLPPLASSLAGYPAPTGPQASLAAARITGADFGTAEARRQAFRRATPLYKDRFTVILRPED